MLNLICLFGRRLLALRYRIRIEGLEAVLNKPDRRGTLLLATHPALIDPVILVCHLFPSFRFHALGDQDQVSRSGLRWWARRFGVIPLPDAAKHGVAVREGVSQSLKECARLLAAGENVLFYPAGHILRERLEHIGGNSGVEYLLRKAPDAGVVLICTRGLWGSFFSRADGSYPHLPRVLRTALKALFANAVFFMPKRRVDIAIWEPDNFPSQGSRRDINTFIETFFNDQAPPNTKVPLWRWKREATCVAPEPPQHSVAVDPDRIPTATRQMVEAKLRELVGHKPIAPEMNLSNDLDLDSLSRLELVIWIEKEFGFQVANPDMLETVMDVMASATGEALAGRVDHLNPVPGHWFKRPPLDHEKPLRLPEASTLTTAFLKQAAVRPRAAILADATGDVKTYRDLITALHVLIALIAKLPGKHIGIMLPATPAAAIVYLATLFARRTPVMLNWTVGQRQLSHMVELMEVQSIVTARKLTVKLKTQGARFGAAESAFVFLEDMASGVSLPAKLLAKLKSYLPWRALKSVAVSDPAVVLFTSGSESLPKAVPLTHANILANLRDILAVRALRADDIIIGFLPPFHSFGLSLTFLLPLLTGLRTVYHANPTEGAVLAALVRHYRATVLPGTPTFLNGILKGARSHDLNSLRIAVTGAEKCPETVYRGLRKMGPELVILEGYGITECSPVVAVNHPDHPVPYSIGKIMDSLEYRIVDENSGNDCPTGCAGMLLVRGPSVFGGYLRHTGASPFVEHNGRTYYRTGDLVMEDEQGVLFFKGRLKRFVKLGGEMISLPAIEEVLNLHYRAESDDGPILAVESMHEDTPEITLFTTRDISREEANAIIREAGLSSLHNIRAVVKAPEIPVLGTGKTDYRSLKSIRETA